jgi:hypothetical protein
VVRAFGYCSVVRLILSTALSTVAVALAVAVFAVPYVRKRRQWGEGSPEAQDALLASSRARQVGMLVVVAVAVCGVVAVRGLS